MGDAIHASRILSVISTVLILAAACLFAPRQGDAHTSSRHTSKIVLKGKALDVGISPGGVVHIIDPKGKAWRWGSSFGEEWSFLGGNGFVRIDSDLSKRPWAVDRKGGIYFHNSAYWEKRGQGAVDIGVGPKGIVLALLKNGRIVGWNPARKRFERYLTAKGRRIDVDEKGRPWIVNHEGRLAHHNGKAWRVFKTKARDVSVAPGGAVFVVRENGSTSQHLASAISQDVPGFTKVVSMSAGPEGHLWAVREDQSILSMSMFEEERGVKPPTIASGPTQEELLNNQRRRRSSVDTSIITSNAPLEFVLVSGILATDVGIGADGSVFASDTNGIFKRFSDSDRVFLTFPGQINTVAVDRQGNPWGVTPSGEVFRHNGTDWVEVDGDFGTARDIAINYRNAVFITNIDQEVFRYDVEEKRFILFPEVKGTRIAVDPKGRPWTVDLDGGVFRCDVEMGCKKTPTTKALDIGIGPDGSIFITSTANDLLRYNRQEEKFEFLPRVSTGVRVVEVGPRGRPWVIDVDGRVFASGFFKRDETDDAKTARSTRTETSDIPTIVFSRNLNLPRFTDVKRRIANAGTVRSSRDGQVMVTADDGAIWRFNRKTKRFEKKSITAPLVAQSAGPAVPITAITPDGRLVYLEDDGGLPNITHRIFRQKKINRTGVEEIASITQNAVNRDGRIHVGPEGTLYLSLIENDLPPRTSRLFRAENGRKTFEEINLTAAGIDPVANFLDVSGGGFENILHNVFFNNDTSRSSIHLLKGKKLEEIFETSKTINGISSNLKTLYACIDTILSRFNASNKSFSRTNIRCENIAVTPEELIFYITP